MACLLPRIAIVGGGPAGLTLGVLLHKRNIPFTIYELRPKPTEESLAQPSGMLDLHDESGLAALRECGLYDEFLTHTGECSEAYKVLDKHGHVHWEDDGGGPSNRPEISRRNLTRLLLSHLPEERVQWGHKLLSARKSASASKDETELDFGAHGKRTFDFVIGADGAWSKIRNLVTDVKPEYAGMQYISLTIREVTRKYPHLAALVGSGTSASVGNYHGVLSQRGIQDSVRIYIYMTITGRNFPSTAGFAGRPAVACKELLLNDANLLGTFGEKVKELVITACEEESADHPGEMVDIRPVDVLPIGHHWPHQAGVTLIGDAAHLQLPFAGEGVNLGMWDSLLLSQVIVKALEMAKGSNDSFQSFLDLLVRDFEAEMAVRAGEKAEEAMANKKMMFGDDAAKNFASFFRNAFAQVAQAEQL